MIFVKSPTGQEIGVLENASKVSYTDTLNELMKASFTMPLDDKKNESIKFTNHIEIRDKEDKHIGLFAVRPKLTRINEIKKQIDYRLEHVASNLLNKVMFGHHKFTGSTSEVIQFILSKQVEKDWVLGECDFTTTKVCSWQNENLLSALYSVAKSFLIPYRWVFDTSSYPFKISLKRIDTAVNSRIIEGYNLKGIDIEENPENIYNVIYGLGAGEGINQLKIAKINGGLNYVQDQTSINTYGRSEYIYVNKELESRQELKNEMLKFLDQHKGPTIKWSGNAFDLSKLTDIAMDKFETGTVVKIALKELGETDLLITSLSKNDIYKNDVNVRIELGNKAETYATANAMQQRRQQILDTYSQGATNIMNLSYKDNCDATHPATMTFTLDEDVLIVNTVKLRLETKKFRAYSGTTKSGGSTTQSSSSGGSSTQTSSTTGSHRHVMMRQGTGMSLLVKDGTIPIMRYGANGVIVPIISSETNMPSSVSTDEATGSHAHTITIPAHTHSVTIPSHAHDIDHKIVELGTLPSSITVTVDGKTVPTTGLNIDKLELVDYLLDANGEVRRGKHEIKVTPNGLARIEVDLELRVFIQSHLGGEY